MNINWVCPIPHTVIYPTYWLIGMSHHTVIYLWTLIGYVPFLILLYTLPRNINGYVPFLILLYTLPMNINGYVPFLILLYTLPTDTLID